MWALKVEFLRIRFFNVLEETKVNSEINFEVNAKVFLINYKDYGFFTVFYHYGNYDYHYLVL